MNHGHSAEHFFNGVCICFCNDCTRHPSREMIQCICPDCPKEKCGLKAAKVVR